MVAGVIVALSLALSPWAPAKWRIDLDIGREAGYSKQESDWGASGARLVLPTTVSIEAEEAKPIEPDPGRCSRIRVEENPKYVTSDGQQTVELGAEGGWKMTTRRTGGPGTAGQIFLWLDVSSGGERQDVNLEPNQRLYLTSNCWRESELKVGLARFEPLRLAYERAQEDLERRLSHESGDRRLDGVNLVDTALASVDMAKLVKKRDDCRSEANEAELTLPNKNKLGRPGRWPGSNELLSVSRGIIIGRKEKKGLFQWGVEEEVLGRWRAVPIPDEESGVDDT